MPNIRVKLNHYKMEQKVRVILCTTHALLVKNKNENNEVLLMFIKHNIFITCIFLTRDLTKSKIIVYKINCSNCDYSYIRQTCQILDIGLSQLSFN